MFFYVSFLRPPPTHVDLASPEPILVALQISNDLRTDPLAAVAVDVFYSWSLAPSSSSAARPRRPATRLTTWTATQTYRQIKVPRPDGVRNGQSWQLVLSADTDDHTIPLADPDIGRTPFAVMSMPVLFTSASASASPRKISSPATTAKQELIRRSYVLGSNTESFHIYEQTSYGLDKNVWDSGVGLSAWLVQTMLDDDGVRGQLCRALFDETPCNVVELGAGTGIVSIALSLVRSRLLHVPDHRLGHILATDLPSAIPLLQHNIALARSRVPLQAVELDWEDTQLPDALTSLDSGIDVILMADVAYNTASFPALVGTLSRLVAFSRSKRANPAPIILLAYKERDAAERTLWDKARDVGIVLEQVDKVDGAGSDAVEIWVGNVVAVDRPWA